MAQQFKVSRSMVRAWRDQEDALHALNLKERKHGDTSRRRRRLKYASSPKFPDMEECLAEWVFAQREDGIGVHGKAISAKARELHAELYEGEPIDFNASKGWLSRFLQRNKLCSRRVTTVGQQLPDDAQDLAKEFLDDVKDDIAANDLAPVAVGNMDESPFWFDLPSNQTYDMQGVKTVRMRTTGHEKLRFSVVLTALANGTKLMPMLIFRNLKNVPKGNFPKNCHIAVSKGGCMTTDLMTQWMDKVWQRRPGNIFRKPGLLVCDKHRSHTHADTVTALKRRFATSVVFIHGGMTSLLQPCDVSWNKSMKSKVRERWNAWLQEGEKEFTRSGKRKRASYDMVAKWVVEAWDEVPREMISTSFVKCGLTPMDSIDLLHSSLQNLLKNEELPDDDVTSGSGEEIDDLCSDEDDEGADDGGIWTVMWMRLSRLEAPVISVRVSFSDSDTSDVDISDNDISDVSFSDDTSDASISDNDVDEDDDSDVELL